MQSARKRDAKFEARSSVSFVKAQLFRSVPLCSAPCRSIPPLWSIGCPNGMPASMWRCVERGLQLVAESRYDYAYQKTDEASAKARAAVREFNTALGFFLDSSGDTDSCNGPAQLTKESFAQLCTLALENSQLSSKDSPGLNYETRLLYISSNVGGRLFYPVWPEEITPVVDCEVLHSSGDPLDLSDVSERLAELETSSPGILGSPDGRYSDPDGRLLLSTEQNQRLLRWARARDMTDALQNLRETEFVQDSVADCSFVASLLSLAYAEARTGEPLVARLICPLPATGGLLSPRGKYVVLLYFNGVRRSVEIDDYLPVLRHKRLFTTVAHDKSQLFPALIEKAYLKVMAGSYEFRGSHAANDTYMLSGWLPEFIHLRAFFDDLLAGNSADSLWTRLFTAWSAGNVMVCLGTGRADRTAETVTDFWFIPEHDYTVKELAEMDGKRMVLVRNPWRGEAETKDNSAENLSAASELPPTDPPTPLETSRWLPFDAVCNLFDNIYLNWNPQAKPCRTQTHFVWDSGTARQFGYAFSCMPQFRLENRHTEPTEVWLLLSRHFTQRPSATSVSEMLALHVVDAPGHHVHAAEGVRFVTRGVELNTYQAFVCVSLPPATAYTVVVGASGFTSDSAVVPFSLFAYSDVPLPKLRKAQPICRYSVRQTGEWHGDSAGGTWTSYSYIRNPMYALRVPSGGAEVRFTLLAGAGVPVALQVFKAESRRRVFRYSPKQLYTVDAEYRDGVYQTVVSLRYFPYVILVPSTLRPGVCGPFRLVVESNESVELTDLPWQPSHNFYKEARVDLVDVAQVAFLVKRAGDVLLHVADTKRGRPLRVRLFDAGGTREVWRSSSPNAGFEPSIFGITEPALTLSAGRYTLVVDRQSSEAGNVLIRAVSEVPIDLEV